MLGPTDVTAHFREQAGWCARLGSPFTAQLLERLTEDFEAGGPVATICGDWSGNPRKDALGLRLCGALHHAVLSGAATELAAVYPNGDRRWDVAEVWPLARDWLAAHVDAVRTFLQHPPQTNETRRSIALLPGFLKIAAQFGLPLNLLELGASAGLNMNWDRFAYRTASWARTGDSDVLVETDWQAGVPDHLDAKIDIAARAACDQNPLDVHDATEALRLRSYIWPDQQDRLARFDAAVALARQNGARVERADALDWLRDKLDDRPSGVTTVVYHSVFLQYPPRDVIASLRQAIEMAGAAATRERPLAWLCYEPEALFGGQDDSPAMCTRLQTWPSDTGADVLLRSDGHVTRVDAPGAG